MTAEQQFFSQKAFARLLAVSPRTIRRWHRAALIRGLRIGGIVRYRLADLDVAGAVNERLREVEADDRGRNPMKGGHA